MSDKKLMNEVLPAPTKSVDDGRARDRVLSHMRKLVKIGAASAALAACPPSSGPFGVVDPLPPPARCKTMNDVLSELSGSVSASDGSGTVTLVINAKTDFQSGVELNMAGSTMGGSIRSLDRAEDSKKMTVVIAPTSQVVVLTLTVSCDGELRPITVTVDTVALTVKFNDPSRDGG